MDKNPSKQARTIRKITFYLFIFAIHSGARATDASSSRDEYFSKLEQIAPPIIRQCIIEHARKLPVNEISEKAASRENPSPSVENQASFTVEYLRETCFIDLENTPATETSDDLWRNPDAFILGLKNRAFMEVYDSKSMQVLAEAYNEHQDCLFGLSYPCIPSNTNGENRLIKQRNNDADRFDFPDSTYPPRGHSQLKTIETKELFGLLVTSTERSHTPMIDDGIDHFKTIFFHKKDMRFAAEFDALYLDFPGKKVGILSDGASSSCMGMEYGNNLIVIDSKASTKLARITLPEGSSNIELQDSLDELQLKFRVRGQQLLNDRREQECELPYWAKHFDYLYTVRCDIGKKKCRVHKKRIHLYQACANIGGCD